MFDEDILIKLRKIQAKQLVKTNETVTFSKVVRDLLRKVLK